LHQAKEGFFVACKEISRPSYHFWKKLVKLLSMYKSLKTDLLQLRRETNGG